jgi:hypothetical protein
MVVDGHEVPYESWNESFYVMFASAIMCAREVRGGNF